MEVLKMKLKIFLGVATVICLLLSNQTTIAMPGGGPSSTVKMCLYDHYNGESGVNHRYKMQLIFQGNCPIIDPPEDSNGTKHQLSENYTTTKYSDRTVYHLKDTHDCQVDITEVDNP